MVAAPLSSTRLGTSRLGAREVLTRHRHRCAYAAIVLRGSYLEAGDEGRFQVAPGDVLVHGEFGAHCDWVDPGGALVLNLPLPEGCALPPRGRVRDLDALVRAAEVDGAAAARLLTDSWAPGAPPRSDWPDELAAALRAGALDLRAWAARMGLAPETVSRGFHLAYGTTARRYRAEARARRAVALLSRSAAPLSAVALGCGFADQPHLTRAVRALTGATPRAWRARGSSRFKTVGAPRP